MVGSYMVVRPKRSERQCRARRSGHVAFSPHAPPEQDIFELLRSRPPGTHAVASVTVRALDDTAAKHLAIVLVHRNRPWNDGVRWKGWLQA